MTTNHPAHDPVSLERLHQIHEILSKAAAQSDGGNLGYAMADAVKVIDGAIAKFEEQDNPRPVMAVKGELGFIDNLEKIIEVRDEDIDIGQLGSSNYDALMLAALDAFRASLPATVVPDEMFNNIDNPYGDEDLIYENGKIEGWNACRAAMLQGAEQQNQQQNIPENIPTLRDGLAAIRNSCMSIDAEKIIAERDALNSPATPDGWIPVSERMPDKLIPVMVMYADGEMWSAIWTGTRWDDGTEFPDPHAVTHWMEMPAAPLQEVNRG